MSYSVLVVDDSNFFRRHLTEIINECPDLKVIGEACNGREAVDMAESLHPDVITMDFEMPVMNGVVAVQKIMENNPTSILMLSSLTFEGARITLDALDAGALDFLPKKFDEIAKRSSGMTKEIHSRILSILKAKNNKVEEKENNKSDGAIKKPIKLTVADLSAMECDLVILGASTGGPVAIATVLHKLPADYPVPIVVVQHMPEAFTPEFAARLDSKVPMKVKQAEDGDRLLPGHVYIAPGGKQLLFGRGSPVRLKVEQGDDRVSFRPSLDITFASAASALGEHVLSVVMTGMGTDGCEGARLLKSVGAKVWTQDADTSLIHGMPSSVINGGYSDLTLPLEQIYRGLMKIAGR